jgi:hypothetical protein
VAKLAFWRTIGDAYLFVFARPLRLLRIGGLWLVLSVLYIYAMEPPSPQGLNAAVLRSYIALVVLGLLFLAVGLISFAVAWCRAVILGEIRPWWAVLRLGRRELRFLGYVVLIGVLVSVPIFACLLLVLRWLALTIQHAPAEFHVVVLWILGFEWVFMLFLWLFCARLTLLFPAVAADERHVLRRAWARGKGSWPRLYFGPICCYLPLAAFESLVLKLLGPGHVVKMKFVFISGFTFSVERGGELHHAIGAVIGFLQLALVIAYYSFAYRQLAGAALSPRDAVPQPLPAG